VLFPGRAVVSAGQVQMQTLLAELPLGPVSEGIYCTSVAIQKWVKMPKHRKSIYFL